MSEWRVKESEWCVQVSEWVREGEWLVHVEVSVVREWCVWLYDGQRQVW